MARVLITGGRGYIGGQTFRTLVELGHEVHSIDRIERNWMLQSDEWGTSICSDFADTDVLRTLYAKGPFDAVIHFAASHQVNESVKNPNEFYSNNVSQTQKFLGNYIRRYKTPVIFSSTASIYGNVPGAVSFKETDLTQPMNPYARSKLAIEWMLQDYQAAYGVDSLVLRYFNAAGADPKGRMGYIQDPMSHVVPILMNKIATRESFSIYGTDYNTKDGTCVRDYTHVQDIADAHVAALNYVLNHKNFYEIVNIGSGVGTSVCELVRETEAVIDVPANYIYEDRRPGDPAYLVANIDKAKEVLNWSPKYTLKDIIEHAWTWEKTKHSVVGLQ